MLVEDWSKTGRRPCWSKLSGSFSKCRESLLNTEMEEALFTFLVAEEAFFSLWRMQFFSLSSFASALGCSLPLEYL